MADLRFRIFRFIETLTSSQGLGSTPTVREIARQLNEPLRNVLVTIKAAEADGMVELLADDPFVEALLYVQQSLSLLL